MKKKSTSPISIRMRQSERKRHLVQGLFSLGTNAYLPGFLKGNIYQGKVKHICLPGLSCYSCPGALGACPMGSLQAGLYDTRQLFPFYVLGLLLFFGLLFGRLICGLLCPFGFLQDLLAKIPCKKYRPELLSPKLDQRLRKLKYLILIFFVFLLPFLGRFFPKLMAPWFCKFICPSGTVMAGWPMLALNENLRRLLGFIFSWKSFLAIGILVAAAFIPRIFCRYICPLGAFYSLFHKLAFYQLSFDKGTCIDCGACKRACPMGVDMPVRYQSPECIHCSRCVASCPRGCLRSGFQKKVSRVTASSEKDL